MLLRPPSVTLATSFEMGTRRTSEVWSRFVRVEIDSGDTYALAEGPINATELMAHLQDTGYCHSNLIMAQEGRGENKDLQSHCTPYLKLCPGRDAVLYKYMKKKKSS